MVHVSVHRGAHVCTGVYIYVYVGIQKPEVDSGWVCPSITPTLLFEAGSLTEPEVDEFN